MIVAFSQQERYNIIENKKGGFKLIGDKLKQLRIERHLTLEDLAKQLNEKYPDTAKFSKGKLSKWENNKEEPKLSSARILADFYNLKIDDFFS